MTFQFQCPQCNSVLQAEPDQAGQASQCPLCHTPFLIPAPVGTQAAARPSFPGPSFPSTPAGFGPPGPFGAATPGPAHIPPFIATEAGLAAPAPEVDPNLLHIPCPQCQEVLETPIEMLDQEVLCPHCQTQFQLLRRNSLEYKRKKQQELEIRERKAGKAWFNFAIVVVVLMVLFLGFLIISTVFG